MSLRQSVVAWVMQRKAILGPGQRAIGWPFLLGYVPWLRDIHPWLDRRLSSITYLPMNATLHPVTQVAPPAVIAAYIEQSPYHVIMERCLCRTARDCKDYPHDIGCLFMGASALKMPPQISRRVSKAEALRHLERAERAGLVPLVGKVRFDNFAFLIPDEKRLLSACFCCPCCCMMAYYRHLPPSQLDAVFPRLEGLTIEVTQACEGCGTCVQSCYVRAISIVNGRAVHSATCRGCGRCARVCPHAAISITLTRDDYQSAVTQRIGAFVDHR